MAITGGLGIIGTTIGATGLTGAITVITGGIAAIPGIATTGAIRDMTAATGVIDVAFGYVGGGEAPAPSCSSAASRLI
jgi:hypothetical protein